MNQPAISTGYLPHDARDDVRELHGLWLFIARIAWIILAAGTLALNAIAIPQFLAMLTTPCASSAHCLYLQLTSYDLRFMNQTGITRNFIASYETWSGIAAMLIFYVIAAVIFWRRSSDRMALLCAFALMLFGGVVFSPTLQYILPLQSIVGYWLFALLYTVAESLLLVFLLLFPNGQFVPRWSRWLIPLIVAYWAFDFFSGQIYNNTFNLMTLVFFVIVLAPLAVQIYRYRRISTSHERQQTKWVVFGFTVSLAGFVLFLITGNLLLPPEALHSTVMTVFVAQTAFAIFLALIPVSITIAILRSRLYDIDVIINRTLVYGLLTAILALIYIAGVVGVQALVNTVAQRHNSEPSPVLIVITTLAIAALFQPLRRRIQRIIDRRFYRRKYDVERTLATFGNALRQEVDLSDLREHLLVVVQETMEPRSLSLWLRTSSPTERH